MGMPPLKKVPSPPISAPCAVSYERCWVVRCVKYGRSMVHLTAPSPSARTGCAWYQYPCRVCISREKGLAVSNAERPPLPHRYIYQTTRGSDATAAARLLKDGSRERERESLIVSSLGGRLMGPHHGSGPPPSSCRPAELMWRSRAQQRRNAFVLGRAQPVPSACAPVTPWAPADLQDGRSGWKSR